MFSLVNVIGLTLDLLAFVFTLAVTAPCFKPFGFPTVPPLGAAFI